MKKGGWGDYLNGKQRGGLGRSLHPGDASFVSGDPRFFGLAGPLHTSSMDDCAPAGRYFAQRDSGVVQIEGHWGL
jgi:hypothetical protein